MRKYISAAFLREVARKYKLLAIFLIIGLLATTGVVFATTFGDDVHVSGDLFVNGGDFNLGTGLATTTINSSNGDMSFLNGGASSSNRMIIKADGKVGIGTTTPQYPFSVSGNANVSNGYLFVDGNLGVGALPSVKLDIVQPGGGTFVRYSDNSNQVSYYGPGPSGNYISIFTASGEGLRLGDDTGGDLAIQSDNVGIGDITPVAKLTVGASDAFQVNASGRVLANVGASGSGNLSYSFVGDTDTGLYRFTTDEIRFQTAGVDRITVNSSGNVGIGTTSPATKLDVNGLVRVYQTATTTCSSSVEGSIFYNSSNQHFWGCDGTNWNRLDN